MTRLKWIGIFIFCLSANVILAQETISLEQAISKALDQNFQIKISELDIQIAEKNNSWARAGRAPIIDLNVGFNNNFVNDNNAASFLQGSYYTGSVGADISAQWLAYGGGRVKIQKEQLDVFEKQTSLAKAEQIHNLINAVSSAYYNLVYQRERQQILEANLSLSKDRLEFEETRFEFGTSSTFNILQFENNVKTDSFNLISQMSAIELAERDLSQIINDIDYVKYIPDQELVVNVEQLDEQKLLDILSEENYSLKTLAVLQDLSTLNTALQETSQRPNITLNGSVGFNENAFKFFADNPSTGEPFPLLFAERFNINFGANMNWNLFDGGVRKIDLENAKLEESKNSLNFLEASAQLKNQLGLLVENYNRQIELLRLSDDQLQISNRSMNMTEERFRGGVLNSLDYRNIQNQNLSAKYSKLTAIYNLVLTKLQIDFLVGRYD